MQYPSPMRKLAQELPVKAKLLLGLILLGIFIVSGCFQFGKPSPETDGGLAAPSGPATSISRCQTVISNPGTYVLKNNIQAADFYDNVEPCIKIEASDVVLNCQGKGLSGPTNIEGIVLKGVNRATVQNCVVNNFVEGIVLSVSNGNRIIGNTVTGNSNAGIRVEVSNNNTFSDNAARENNWGFVLDFSSNNILRNNVAESNLNRGFSLSEFDTANNVFENNRALNNEGVDFSCLSQSPNQDLKNICGTNECRSWLRSCSPTEGPTSQQQAEAAKTLNSFFNNLLTSLGGTEQAAQVRPLLGDCRPTGNTLWKEMAVSSQGIDYLSVVGFADVGQGDSFGFCIATNSDLGSIPVYIRQLQRERQEVVLTLQDNYIYWELESGEDFYRQSAAKYNQKGNRILTISVYAHGTDINIDALQAAISNAESAL